MLGPCGGKTEAAWTRRLPYSSVGGCDKDGPYRTSARNPRYRRPSDYLRWVQRVVPPSPARSRSRSSEVLLGILLLRVLAMKLSGLGECRLQRILRAVEEPCRRGEWTSLTAGSQIIRVFWTKPSDFDQILAVAIWTVCIHERASLSR